MDRPGKNGGTLRSYEKGQSGNPAGRPPQKSGLISQMLQELGDDWHDLAVTIIGYSTDRQPTVYQLRYSTHGQQTVNALIAVQLLMRSVDGSMEAIKIVLDRTEGRVAPPIAIGPQIHAPNVSVITYQPNSIAKTRPKCGNGLIPNNDEETCKNGFINRVKSQLFSAFFNIL